MLSLARSLERRSADLCARTAALACACAEIQAAAALKELLAVVLAVGGAAVDAEVAG